MSRTRRQSSSPTGTRGHARRHDSDSAACSSAVEDRQQEPSLESLFMEGVCQIGQLLLKRLVGLVRTKRAMVLLIVFGIFGIMNPALAKLTPWMLSLMSESSPEQGITFGAITVDALTSWTQYFRDLMMEYILILAMFSGIFAGNTKAARWSTCSQRRFPQQGRWFKTTRGAADMDGLLLAERSLSRWVTPPISGITRLPSGIWLAAICAYMMGDGSCRWSLRLPPRCPPACMRCCSRAGSLRCSSLGYAAAARAILAVTLGRWSGLVDRGYNPRTSCPRSGSPLRSRRFNLRYVVGIRKKRLSSFVLSRHKNAAQKGRRFISDQYYRSSHQAL
ncbi:MAG: hypothetical protein R2912_01545 [Eubacteriales bacterium]